MHTKNKLGPRKAKLRSLYLLPVLVLPFTTLGFWSLGGGSDAAPGAKDSLKRAQMLEVPAAELSAKDELDKMDLYAKEKQKGEGGFDFFNQEEPLPSSFDAYFQDSLTALSKGKEHQSTVPASEVQSWNNEQSSTIHERLISLQQQLSQQEPSLPAENGYRSAPSMSYESSEDVEKLQMLMETMNTQKSEDPELTQLSSMLEKIIDIQHPERIQQEIKDHQLAEKEAVYTLEPNNSNWLTIIKNDSSIHAVQAGFFGLENPEEVQFQKQNAIQAQVHGKQTLVNGSTLKMSLLQEVQLAGYTVKKNSFLYGIVSLQGDRLQVKINGIRVGQSILPIDLDLYDLDGLAGIYIPGSISKESLKGSMDRSIQSVGLNDLDPSIGAKALDAGLEAAKNLISQKTKLIKVTLKDGYRILLKQKL